MPTIDAQVHAYEHDHPARPWAGILHGPSAVTGAQMVAAMDEVGVDGALLVSPFSMYRYDASYALQVHADHPGRFGLIKPVDPTDSAVDDVIADWAATPGTVAIRIMLNREAATDPADPGINRVMAAAARHSLPVNLLCWGRLPQATGLAARNPETVIVVDHLGLQQPFEPPVPVAPWADLPQVLTLAGHANVRIKISGACTLSHEPYPYNDIWDPVCRILDAFGLDRCMWGTDWTRAVAFLTYAQGSSRFAPPIACPTATVRCSWAGPCRASMASRRRSRCSQRRNDAAASSYSRQPCTLQNRDPRMKKKQCHSTEA